MKIKYLFMSALACGLLGACNNDEVVENGDNNFAGGEAYVKVRIAMSDGAATRATSGGYDEGTTAEQAIQNIQFAFYDNAGNWVADGIRQGQTAVEPSTGYVEGIAEAVVALELDKDAPKPTQVIAYVNVPTGFSTTGQSIDQMQTLMAESAQSVSTASNFIMTNSTYWNNGEVIGATVPEEAFKESEDAALADNAPVKIYVERLAAKVTVKQGENLAENTEDLQSSHYTLSFKLEGFALNGLNQKEYYLKNLDAAWNATTPWNGWNDAADSRSFWAEDPNYAAAPAEDDIQFVTFNNVQDITTEAPEYTAYCKENTLTNARYEAGNFQEATHVLVVGHYELTDNENPDAGVIKGTDDQPITFYMYRNTAYLEEDLMNIVANMGFVYTQSTEGTETTYTLAGPDAYKLIESAEDEIQDGADNNKLTAALDWTAESQTTYYTTENGKDFTPVTADNLAALNKKIAETVGTAEAYTRGMAYFAVPIEHLAGKGVDGHIGVVRNHSYVLTVQSIKGMGDGVFNPDEIIIPTPPTNRYYVGATLNILSWHIVSQDVNL